MSNRCPIAKTTIVLAWVCSFLVNGCMPRRTVSIPDAPPPYPTFPLPKQDNLKNQKFTHQSNNSPEQSNLHGSPPSQSQSDPSYNYIAPTTATKASAKSSDRRSNFTNTKSQPRFTLEATEELWALVQDDKGNEIQWLKMKSGEAAFIYEKGPLVLTCSSANLLKIKDSLGQPVEFNSRSNGVSIIRLLP